MQMARKQQAEQWAEHRRRRDEEGRQSRAMVITELDAGDPEATMHALANEILRYREALRLLAAAIGWADAGAPFGLRVDSVRSSGPHPLSKTHQWPSYWLASRASAKIIQ